MNSVGHLDDFRALDPFFDLAVHRDRETGVVVLEYASEGRVVGTGAHYSNRYVSVLTIIERKITRWRDYLAPIAVFDATGWPAPRPSPPAERGLAGLTAPSLSRELQGVGGH